MPYYSTTYQGIRVSLHEIQQAFKSELSEPDNILGTVQYIQDLPRRNYNYGSQREAEYREGIAWFIEAIKSDQLEDVKHLNFYRGALAVLLTAERIYQRGQEDNTYIAKAKNITKALDTTLLRAHAEQVLVRKELPIGSVSKGTYEGWLPETA